MNAQKFIHGSKFEPRHTFLALRMGTLLRSFEIRIKEKHFYLTILFDSYDKTVTITK